MDEEGVTPDTAIRSGLELLKVHHKAMLNVYWMEFSDVYVLIYDF